MAEKKSGQTRVECPDCGGDGVVSFGTEDIPCELCNGSGKVTAKKAAAATEDRPPPHGT